MNRYFQSVILLCQRWHWYSYIAAGSVSISQSYSNLLWMEHKPFSSVGCEDDSPSCLKRKLQEQYTRESFLIPYDVSVQTSCSNFFPREVFSCSFVFSVQHICTDQIHAAWQMCMNSHGRSWTLNIKIEMHACNSHLGGSYYHPWPMSP